MKNKPLTMDEVDRWADSLPENHTVTKTARGIASRYRHPRSNDAVREFALWLKHVRAAPVRYQMRLRAARLILGFVSFPLF